MKYKQNKISQTKKLKIGVLLWVMISISLFSYPNTTKAEVSIIKRVGNTFNSISDSIAEGWYIFIQGYINGTDEIITNTKEVFTSPVDTKEVIKEEKKVTKPNIQKTTSPQTKTETKKEIVNKVTNVKGEKGDKGDKGEKGDKGDSSYFDQSYFVSQKMFSGQVDRIYESLNKNINNTEESIREDMDALVSGVNSVNTKTGVVTLTTTDIGEGTNLYFTNARAQSALLGLYQPLGNELTLLQALSDTVGFLRKTGDGTYSIDTNTYSTDIHSNITALNNLLGTNTGDETVTTIKTKLGSATTALDGYLTSTDWNIFNNKQNALTNPVTGTGTTNYLSKYTGTSTIGNSVIYDNGTNVGIGTTSPTSILTVSGGNLTIAGSGNIALTGGYIGIPGGSFIGAGNALFIGGSPNDLAFEATSGDFTFGLNVNEVARIKNTGFMGLKTASPTNIISLGGTSARTIWMERNTTAGTAGQGLTLSSGGAIAGTADLAGGDLNLKSGISTGTGTSALRFFTATAGSTGTTDNTPTEKMTILGSGNVGIGVTNPSEKLYVSGSMRLDGSITIPVNGSVGSSSIRTTYGSQAWTTNIGRWAQFIHDHDTNVENWDIFDFYSTGSGQIAATASNQAFMLLRPKIAQSGTASYDAIKVDVTETSLGNGSSGDGNNLLNLAVGGTSKFVVNNTGSVGIGTTAPSQKLEIVSGALHINYGVNRTVTIDETGMSVVRGADFTIQNTSRALVLTSNRNVNINSGSGYDITLTSADDILLQPTDNVGIGTTSPNVKLNISTGNGAPQDVPLASTLLKLDTTGALGTKSGIEFTAGYVPTGSNTSYRIGAIYAIADANDYAQARLTLTSRNAAGTDLDTLSLKNGSVGIGTTTPTAVLHLKAGTATAGTAPLKFTTGSLLTTPEPGAVEYDNSGYYGTVSLNIGDSYGGGKIAYILQPGDPGYDATQIKGIIAATSDQSVGVVWGCNGTDISGAAGTALGTGYQNTADIIAGCATTAAKVARLYNGGGYTDWYLPSKDEINNVYLNKVVIGGFSGHYWSSSETGSTGAWAMESSGNQYNDSKVNIFHVRAVRSFAIPLRQKFAFSSDVSNLYLPYSGATSNVDLGVNNLTVDTNSLFVDSVNHRVGMGTLTPTNLLSLGGTTARTIWMERNTTAGTAGQGLTLSSGGAIAGTADLAGGDLNLKSGISTGTGTSALRFFTATAGSTGTTDNTPTEKMTILGNGNVGIGTTSPTRMLDVAGNVKVGNYLYVGDYGTVVSTLNLDSEESLSLTSVKSVDVTLGTNGYYNIYGAGGLQMYIRGGDGRVNMKGRLIVENTGDTTIAGNVGIGTTSPAYQFTIASDLNNETTRGITVLQGSNTASGANLNFRKSRGTFASPASVSNSDYINLTTFYAYTDQWKSPASFGAFVDGVVSSGVNPTSMYFATGVGNESYSPFSNSSVRLYLGPTGAVGLGGSMNTMGSFAGSKMVIDTSGNVGIGTTNPTSILQIGSFSGSANNTLQILSGNGAATLKLADDNANYGFDIVNSPSGYLQFLSHPNSSVGTLRMQINRNGGLDVRGTIVASSVDGPMIHVASSTWPGEYYAGIGGTVIDPTGHVSGSLRFFTRKLAADTNLTEQMVILPSGNVGIGTTAPAFLLDIYKVGTGVQVLSQIKSDAGGFKLGSYGSGWGGFWASAVTPATNNYALIAHSSGTALNAPSGGAIQFDIADVVKMNLSPTGGLALGYSDTNPGAGNLIISGNVGIGTTAPGAKLDVVGGAINVPHSIGQTGGYSINTNNVLSQGGAGYSDSTLVINRSGLSNVVITGNVGIGTTAPNASLTFANAGRIGWINSNSYTFGIDKTTNDFHIVSTSTTDFSSNEDRLTILGASGNVGIGTTAPVNQLDVRTTGDYIFAGQGAGGKGFVLANNASYADVVGLNATHGAYNDIDFRTSADAGQLYLKTGGNVGIGTTGPKSKTEIKSSSAVTTAGAYSSSLLNLYNSTNVGDYSQITYGWGGTYAEAYSGFVSTDNNSYGFGDLVFGTRSVTTDTQPSERMRITGAGNVGIGTTAPNFGLQVSSSIAAFKDDGLSHYVLAGVNDVPGNWRYAGITYDRANSVAKFGNYLNAGLGEQGYIAINNSGNVGIGTTSPAVKLHIQDIANTRLRLTNSEVALSQNDVIGGIEFETKDVSTTTGVTAKMSVISNANNATHLGFFTSQTDSTDISEKMRITNTGNVGIGTTVPATSLVLSKSAVYTEAFGSTNNPALRIINTDAGDLGTKAEIQFMAGSRDTPSAVIASTFSEWTSGWDFGNDLVFLTKPAGSSNPLAERMRIKYNGNVGIGTTSPSGTLDVRGGAAAINVDGSSIYLYAQNGGVYNTRQTTGGNIILMPGIGDNGNGPNNGNVGIGTTSPGAKLDVSTSITGSIRQSGPNTIYKNFELYDTTGSKMWQWSMRREAEEASRLELYYYNGTSWVGPNIAVSATGKVGINYADPGTAQLAINGNVGIGTTSPALTLHTAGVNGFPATTGSTQTAGSFRVGASTSLRVLDFGINGASSTAWMQSTTSNSLGDTNILSINPNGGNVGIGTTNPASKLDIKGRTMVRSATSNKYLNIETTTYSDISSWDSDLGVAHNIVLNKDGGNVGIGTTAPGGKLQITVPSSETWPTLGTAAGSLRIAGSTNAWGMYEGLNDGTGGGWIQVMRGDAATAYNLSLQPVGGYVGIGMTNPSVALDVTGDIEYTGTITDVSDERLKENINDITSTDALTIIRNLQAKTFNMIGGNGRKEYGFIAQEVQSIFPDAVSTIDPDTGYLGINYISFIPIISQSIKEMDLKLENLSSLDIANENSLGSIMRRFLADVENNIEEIFVKKSHQEILCVGPKGNETCITKEVLDEIIREKASSVIIDNQPPTSGGGENVETIINELPPAVEEQEETETIINEPLPVENTNVEESVESVTN